MENAVTVQERSDIQPATAMTPMQMVAFAVQQGHDIERIRELMQLEREWKAERAREAYFEALAQFKAQPLNVSKDKKNNQYNSMYTTLGNLVNTVNTAMAPFGLNARWDLQQGSEITVTCILSHTLGHSERVSLSGPPDDSGKKNSLQQIKSTVTYLQAATFQAITGVVSKEATVDDDGNGAGKAKETISAAQYAEIEKLIADTESDRAAFLKWCQIDQLEDLLASSFDRVVRTLRSKLKDSELSGDKDE